MPVAEDGTLSVEKTPAYFTQPPYQLPQMINNAVPDAKFILILCDPVKRVLSNFVQEVRDTFNWCALRVFIKNVFIDICHLVNYV